VIAGRLGWAPARSMLSEDDHGQTDEQQVMADGIFVLRDGELVELATEPFVTEDAFQKLLAEHPAILAGDRSDADTADRWLLVRREMGVPDQQFGSDRWAVDHLFLDQDGVPTLVEVKRGTDPRIRRELVGQMLDYAANAVVHWPVERIRSRFLDRCEAEKINADEKLAAFLGEEADPDTFWANVKRNLEARKVRMVFVADVISDELRRIVEFLNEQMDPAEVLALEIKQYTARDLRTLVCNLIGQTARAEVRKGTSRGPARTWDEEAFFSGAAGMCIPSVVDVLKRLYDWGRANHAISWGKGQTRGSFGIKHREAGKPVLWARAGGYISLALSNLERMPPFHDAEQCRVLIGKLNAVSGVAIPETAIEDKAWPSIQLEPLARLGGLDQLLDAFGWALGEIERARG
jgi:hypothetical protein